MRSLRSFSSYMLIRSLSGLALGICIACAAICACAQAASPDAPAPQVTRVWGYAGLSAQLLRWESEYQTLHPEVRFDNQLHGAAAVMAGLYDGVADVALMG